MVEPVETERDLPERDWDVAAAYLRPTAAERPDIAEAVMARLRRGDRRRRLVILGSGLVGMGVAVAAMAAAGLTASGVLSAMRPLEMDPQAVLILGLGVFGLALARARSGTPRPSLL
jgi:hypothetical protein